MIWGILMCLFVSARAVSNLFPQEAISQNMKQSLPFMEQYPMFGLKMHGWDATTQVDNYTELYIINCALSSIGDNPIKEAIANPVITGVDGTWLDRANYLTSIGKSEIKEIEKDNKITYWWGILSILRPLIATMSYASAIKVLQLVFMVCLFIYLVLLVKKIDLGCALLFIVGLWSINGYVTSMNFYFASTFIVMMCVCIYILMSKKIYDNYICTFWVVGIITPYFDQFSATSLTITIPLIIFILLYNKREKLDYKKAIKVGFWSSFMWGSGYFVSVVSKWILAALAGFADWEMVLKRVVASGYVEVEWLPSDSLELAKYAIKANYDKINFIMLSKNSSFIKGILIFFICTILLLLLLFHKKFQGIILVLCIIMIIPLLWYIVFKGHTAIHSWFTYRHTLATVFGGTLVIYNLFDYEKFKRTMKKIVEKSL